MGESGDVSVTVQSSFEGLDLAGKVAVVTGASRGIGQAVSQLLRARGAHVYEVSLNAEDGPNRLSADVGSAEHCSRIASWVAQNHDAVHILVNNAGISAFDLDLERATEADWDRTLAVNAKSVFLLSKALLPALKKAHGSSIVNVSSVHAVATAPGVAPYAASKGATVSLTRSMAIDLARHRIRVIAVLPGATATDMLNEYAEKSGGTLEELGFKDGQDQLPRVCTPLEVAEAIVFAASPAASGITGSTITVDGGLLAGFS
jgi:NAD(P)-dependent dehydrogenase (short-subunit alcohol dehydrogenase family)